MNSQNIQKVYDVLKSTLPNKDIVLTAYHDSMVNQYNIVRLFRNAIVTGSLVALIISLIGLMAYTKNEIVRRGAEIAIRKVNGARSSDIIRMLSKNIFWLAIAALAIGCTATAYIASMLMGDFSVRVALTPLLFIGCGLVVLAITLSVVILSSWRIATQNPVVSLKND